jgi:hypothetical protein
MKFYNYETLWILSHGNPSKLFDYFKKSTVGDNFIVNPKVLVDSFWLTDRQRAEYLGICALRSYSDYVQNKEVNLTRDFIPPWVPLEVIEKHPLIKLTNTQIILLKEKI